MGRMAKQILPSWKESFHWHVDGAEIQRSIMSCRVSVDFCLFCSREHVLAKLCDSCLSKSVYLDSRCTSYFYDHQIQKLLLGLKYNAWFWTLPILFQKFEPFPFSLEEFDCIVPVPLHWSRKLQRGYNQCDLIASELMKVSGLRVKSLLRRRLSTKRQFLLGKNHREHNLMEAFSFAKDRSVFRKVLLVDDIYTTGATANAAAYALKKGGVESVSVYTIAIARSKFDRGEGKMYDSAQLRSHL